MSNSPSSDLSEYSQKNSELWQVYVQTHSGINSYLDKALRAQADIKLDDFQILTILTNGGVYTDSPQVLRMGEIAATLNASPSRLTYQIERLIGLGWVERTAVKEDRRGKGVFITENGYERYMEAYKVHSHLLNNVIMEKVTVKEAETLQTVMIKMLESLNN